LRNKEGARGWIFLRRRRTLFRVTVKVLHSLDGPGTNTDAVAMVIWIVSVHDAVSTSVVDQDFSRHFGARKWFANFLRRLTALVVPTAHNKTSHQHPNMPKTTDTQLATTGRSDTDERNAHREALLQRLGFPAQTLPLKKNDLIMRVTVSPKKEHFEIPAAVYPLLWNFLLDSTNKSAVDLQTISSFLLVNKCSKDAFYACKGQLHCAKSLQRHFFIVKKCEENMPFKLIAVVNSNRNLGERIEQLLVTIMRLCIFFMIVLHFLNLLLFVY